MTHVVLEILASGAVTAVGLTAPQTCAAIRAGIKRFSPIEAQVLEHLEPQIGARVAADPRLRADPATWLLNLAGRALSECEPASSEGAEDTTLLYLVPESHRGHPLSSNVSDSALLERLELHVGRRFAPNSRVLRSGAAGCIEALGLARELLAQGTPRCLIGGADSLLRRADIDRLAAADRLLGPLQSQGLIPGEGAAFMLVGLADSNPTPTEADAPPRARIHGLGIGYERNTALGTAYAVGDAMQDALSAALADAEINESEVAFVASNFNGERYDAWERAHAHARNYRTRRERLMVSWPAASVGEIGVAGGVLALIDTVAAIDGEYAPGTTATVEVRSETELRGIAVVMA